MNLNKILDDKLFNIPEAAAPAAPPVAPPKPSRTVPSKPQPKPSPFNPPRPAQQPVPKNMAPAPAAPVAPPRPARPPARPQPKPGPFNPPRPAQQPVPKNGLKEDYEQEAHPRTVGFWRGLPRNQGHILGKHPVFALYGHDLSKTSYDYTTGKYDRNPRRMMQYVQSIHRLEAGHEEELTNLAKKIVCKIWGVPEEMLDAQMGQGGVEHNRQRIPPPADIEKHRKQINKRLTLNSLIHGSAVHAMFSIHHAVNQEIARINPELLDLYTKISASSHHMYWLMDIGMMMQMIGGAVGSTNVVYDEDDQPVVKARGVNFPVLVQELMKGVAELISHHGLSNLTPEEVSATLQHADAIDHEPYLIQAGPELWRKFLKVKPRDIPQAEMFQALSMQEPDDLHKIMTAVIENPEEAAELLRNLVAQPEQFDIDEYNPDETDDWNV